MNWMTNDQHRDVWLEEVVKPVGLRAFFKDCVNGARLAFEEITDGVDPCF